LSCFRDDDTARVAILTGTGTKGFCTGADLRETLPPRNSFASAMFTNDEEGIREGNYIRGLDIERLRIGKPLIAAINGIAVGGGLEIAMACDIRIASETATFGLPEVKRGSIPAVGGIHQLMQSVGHSAALTMILGGDSVDAETALRIGLVSEVHPHGALLERANALAETIASNAPLAVRAARMLALEGADLSLPQALLLEQLAWGLLRDTDDRIEGRRSFAEKRAPIFTGK
jgi:E-phenylitaconyl-CoA hydratase